MDTTQYQKLTNLDFLNPHENTNTKFCLNTNATHETKYPLLL